MTRKRTTLAAACVAVAAMGLSAQSAFAGDVRVIDQSTGHPRLQFTETRTAPDPVTGKTSNVPEKNTITISESSGRVVVHDATTPLNQVAGKNYPGCVGVDANTVSCDATALSQLFFDLGDLDDSFDNTMTTPIPALVIGGSGTDTIVNAGPGDDLLSINGGAKPEADIVQQCGAGNDTVDADRKDDLTAAKNCETIKIGGVVQGGPPPPPGGGGTPPPPAGKPVISASPVGTAAPVSATQLAVAPTKKAGACVTPFIGTAAADRIEGSPSGDKEFGLAGNDFMRGQAGDDCLYGLDGNDTLLGEEGLDLLVGGNGSELEFGGPGNDRLYGNAGNDRLNGDAGADRLSGGAGNDRLRGGLGNDQLFGGLGNDLIDGGPGSDVISGGPGADHVIAGPGNDRINVRDHHRDVVNCGSGRDSVTADRVDKLINCERVIRRR